MHLAEFQARQFMKCFELCWSCWAPCIRGWSEKFSS